MNNRIKQARKECGLTQRQLGEKLGVASTNVSFWEQGINKPSVRNLKNLAEVLGVSIDWLEKGDRHSTKDTGHSDVLSWELPDVVDFKMVESDSIMVPCINDASNDGSCGEIDRSKLLAVQKDLLQLYRLQPRHLAAVTMYDSSMEPSITKNDLLIVDTNVKTVEPDGKRIYALTKDGDTLVICRVNKDAFGITMWVDSRGRDSAISITDPEWRRYKVVGRVVMRTAITEL